MILVVRPEPGASATAARARAIMALETDIARVHWTQVESRDATKTYNKMSVADLARTAPGFDFATYLNAVGTPVQTLVVGQPSAITGIARAIDAAPLAVLKDQLLIRTLDPDRGWRSALGLGLERLGRRVWPNSGAHVAPRPVPALLDVLAEEG